MKEDLLLTVNVVGIPSSVVLMRELFKLCDGFYEDLEMICIFCENDKYLI